MDKNSSRFNLQVTILPGRDLTAAWRKPVPCPGNRIKPGTYHSASLLQAYLRQRPQQPSSSLVKKMNQLANGKHCIKVKGWECRLRKGNLGKRCSLNYIQHRFPPDHRARWILDSDSMHKVVSLSSSSGFSIMRCQERCQVDQAVLRSCPLPWF